MSNLWPPGLQETASNVRPWSCATGASAGVDLGESYQLGFDAGRRTVEDEVSAERALLATIVDALEAVRFDDAKITGMIISAVERLVSDIVGLATPDPALLQRRALAVAGLVASEGQVRIFCNLHDLELLRELPQVLTVSPDPDLRRGDVRAVAGSLAAEDGISHALERLFHELQS